MGLYQNVSKINSCLELMDPFVCLCNYRKINLDNFVNIFYIVHILLVAKPLPKPKKTNNFVWLKEKI